MQSKKSESSPSCRLVTHNMLTSAAFFETVQSVSWRNIEDLSAFIDLFCLYDKVAIIGRASSSKELSTWGSEFFGLLEDLQFVDVQEPDNLKTEAVIKSASRHLAMFAGEQEFDKFNKLFNFALESKEYDLRREPVTEIFNTMMHKKRSTIGWEGESVGKWLFNDPSRTNILKGLSGGRSDIFLIRSFLYLAYADVNQLSFTPDSIRQPVIKTILDEEEQFRGKLLSTIQSSWEENIPSDKRLLSRVSPFAAVIFRDSGKSKKNIFPQMQKLRTDLTSLRQRLRSIEDKLLGYESVADAINAQEKWNEAINEVAASLEVSHPLKVTSNFMLNLAEPIGSVLDQPQSWASWGKLLALPIHLAKRIAARRTVVELHEIIDPRYLPGPGKLKYYINEIFGEVTETSR